MNSTEQPTFGIHQPSFVVGIRASAGDLKSLEKLFENLPADTGVAFVIIQHLSPDFKSMMYELLAHDTKMEIQRVEHGMLIEEKCLPSAPKKRNSSSLEASCI